LFAKKPNNSEPHASQRWQKATTRRIIASNAIQMPKRGKKPSIKPYEFLDADWIGQRHAPGTFNGSAKNILF
jgi:hypothetical protein